MAEISEKFPRLPSLAEDSENTPLLPPAGGKTPGPRDLVCASCNTIYENSLGVLKIVQPDKEAKRFPSPAEKIHTDHLLEGNRLAFGPVDLRCATCHAVFADKYAILERVQPDEEAKQLAIKHINERHPETIQALVTYYAGVPAKDAAGARFSSLDLDDMYITTVANVEYKIPFSPPLLNWEHRRNRIPRMVFATTVRWVAPNHPLHYAILAGMALYVLALAGLAAGLVTHGPLAAWLDTVIPFGGAESFGFALIISLVVVTLLHLAEMTHFVVSRLQPRGILPAHAVFWQWTLSALVEGYGAFDRWDRYMDALDRHAELQQCCN